MEQVPDPQSRERFADLGELIIFHGGEWTEEDYEALPDEVRAELHDGRLILVPSPEPDHQLASRRLANWLSARIGDDRLVIEDVDVRMAEGRRYRTPDITVLREWHGKRPIPPHKVLLVCEIVSPGGGDEHDQKMTAYGQAGLEWYLILDPSPAGYSAELLHLVDGVYAVTAKAPPGGILRLPAPFDGDLDLSTLRP